MIAAILAFLSAAGLGAVGTLSTFFSFANIAGVLGAVLKFFTDLIATPVGAALAAGLIMFFVGSFHGGHVEDAKWQTKWDTAQTLFEQQRVDRDKAVKLEVEADANKRLDEITARKTELEQKVKDYEDEEAKQLAVGNSTAKSVGSCLTDSSDDKWLSDAQSKRGGKPSFVGGLTKRLRAVGTGSADPKHQGPEGQAKVAAPRP